jgi:hypothetical protein
MTRAATQTDLDEIEQRSKAYLESGGDPGVRPDQVFWGDHRPTRQDGAVAECLDREPPCDPDSEKMLLRSIMLVPDTLENEDVTADLFHKEINRTVYLVIAQLAEDRLPRDVAHVCQKLAENEQLDALGGRSRIAELLAGDALPASTPVYISALKDKHARRKLLYAGMNLIQDVHNPECSTNEIAIWTAERARKAQDVLNSVERIEPVRVRDLIAKNPRLHEPVIDGLLRREETMNIIAAPKVGKSWLSYLVALTKGCGGRLFDTFDCPPGKVLLVDNELHAPTLAHRIADVAYAMGLTKDDYGDAITVLSLRGRLRDLHGIVEILDSFKPGQFDVCILDAWYRAIPSGTSENDNAAVANLYNVIDAAARRSALSWINIHHASKGGQAEKSVTDVGAGAGAQSRAADAHVILRPHEEDKAVVLEAVVRSFPPVPPLPLRWEFPLWVADTTLDPNLVRGRLNKSEEKQLDKDKVAKDKILAVLVKEPQNARFLRGVIGAGPDRTNRLLDALEAAEAVEWEEVKAKGGTQRVYRLKESGL